MVAKLNLEDFAYELPEELIAKNPVEKRDESRLLYYNRDRKSLSHHLFRDLNSLLKKDDVLVVNNTQVIPAKLIGQRATGGIVEFLLLKPEPKKPGIWQAMATQIKKLKEGEKIDIQGKNAKHFLTIEEIFIASDGQKRLLVKLGNDSDSTFKILQDVGNAPLPPYIVQARQKANAQKIRQEDIHNAVDLSRYQTIYAKEPGAVAAPTAGLHFSSALLAALQEKGISIFEITLHVGPGTFKSITSSIEEHFIEPEWYAIDKMTCENINAAKKAGRRIIAVGTTTCRALESACLSGQLKATPGTNTSLFIKPGYQFKFIDGLITNFHLSKSSLLLLVAALIGKEALINAYKIAIAQKYRFYSYGDAMLIL